MLASSAGSSAAVVERRGEMRALRREPLGGAQPVDAVHPGEVLGDGAGLVGLQPADVMPGQFHAGQRRQLRQGILQVVLAEVFHAQLRHCLDGRGVAPLADRQQRDAVLIPSGGGGGGGDPGAQRAKTRRPIVDGR